MLTDDEKRTIAALTFNDTLYKECITCVNNVPFQRKSCSTCSVLRSESYEPDFLKIYYTRQQ